MTTLTRPDSYPSDSYPSDSKNSDNKNSGDADHQRAPRQTRIISPAVISGVVATMFSGAIFGVFYAWVSTTMWGLDAADPRVAIEAMQAMNANVRNPAFFAVFFLTPVALLIAAGFALRERATRSAALFATASAVYFLGGLLFTRFYPVPLNQELADVIVPESIEAAETIWNDYSGTWQFWNVTRTVFCGISLALASLGLINITVGGSR